MNNKEILSEVSLQLGDSSFKDFPVDVYSQAIYRSKRKICKKYNITHKVFTTTWGGISSDLESDAILDIPDLREETYVSANEVQLNKVGLNADTFGDYYLVYIGNELHFNYTTYNKALTDEVSIIYSFIPDKDTDKNDYVIPSKYEEEIIKEATLFLVKQGIAKFAGVEQMFNKYKAILQLLKSEGNDEYDKDLTENNDWVTVKVWHPF